MKERETPLIIKTKQTNKTPVLAQSGYHIDLAWTAMLLFLFGEAREEVL